MGLVDDRRLLPADLCKPGIELGSSLAPHAGDSVYVQRRQVDELGKGTRGILVACFDEQAPVAVLQGQVDPLRIEVSPRLSAAVDDAVTVAGLPRGGERCRWSHERPEARREGHDLVAGVETILVDDERAGAPSSAGSTPWRAFLRRR